jgi:hypothetical protein
MDTVERQKLRLEILKKLCEALNYDINNTMNNVYNVIELFTENKEYIWSNLSYLEEKGYVQYKLFKGIASVDNEPKNIKLTSKAIDLIEKLETNMPTDYYQQDFSSTALSNFRDINNSYIILNSPNASITIPNNDSEKILNYLKDLLEKNPNNQTIKDIYEKTEEKIKNNTLTKDYLQGVGFALTAVFNMGISITSNLLTPEIIALFNMAKTLIP